MRKLLLISMALSACLGLLSFSANATPTSVDLSGCGGLSSCTSDGVTFTGWQYNTGWVSANLTYKAGANNETGLGVACTTGPKCGQNEINDTPPQLIAVDLGAINFTSLSLSVGSLDSGGNPGNEIAYIYGATCADPSSCGAGLLASYTGSDYPNNAYTFNFTASDLTGTNSLWVTPIAPTDGASVNDANFLLAGVTYNRVPEPAELGMFGLGLLLIAAFMGLRRRTH